MINYNWEEAVTEMGLGISCCPKPAEGRNLYLVWKRMQPGLVGLLNSLQGMHVSVSNFNGRSGVVTIQELKIKLNLDSQGHLWYMLANGTFTITVEVEGYIPMTKMVRILTSEFTEINFALPYPSGLPGAITVLIFSSVIVCILLCTLFVHCQRQNKKAARSYDGFQLLAREERNLFEDEYDEEDETEMFDKSVAQFGLKMPAAKVYRDFSSSEEEVDEDSFLKVPVNATEDAVKWNNAF